MEHVMYLKLSKKLKFTSIELKKWGYKFKYMFFVWLTKILTKYTHQSSSYPYIYYNKKMY